MTPHSTGSASWLLHLLRACLLSSCCSWGPTGRSARGWTCSPHSCRGAACPTGPCIHPAPRCSPAPN
eukprot:7761743-Alexandrium_andersonii.AAC.1